MVRHLILQRIDHKRGFLKFADALTAILKGIPMKTQDVRFDTLMRLLCRQNGGTFVGLSRF